MGTAAPTNAPTAAPMVRLERVSKVYGKEGREVRALSDVTLTIQTGEFVAITGPSGAGKTTLLQILGCLDVPTSGTYQLDGTRVDGLNDDQLSRVRNAKLGFVFQTFNLVPRTTALENVELPLLYACDGGTSTDAKALLGRVGLSARASHFPTELSGGEQQRVAIARALVMNPKLLLADEPTGNLDSKTGDEIMKVLHELHAQGLTIALITHDPLIAAQAQRTISLKDGRVVDARSQSVEG